MNLPERKISRRELLKLGGLAGLAGALRPTAWAAEEAMPAEPALPQVPRRVLGKTGEKIPILLMGMSLKLDQKFDPRLAEALRFGVYYYDNARGYANGTSETAMGNFMERVGDRKKFWITTKSPDHTPEGMERNLAESLRQLKTDYVDLFFMHALRDKKYLSAETAAAAAKLKKEGKIRYFGFSCHNENVAELMQEAAKLPWIDAIMFKYNFRDYGNKELNDAMDACHKANIGLIAMKTQGSAVSFEDRVAKFAGGKWNRHQAVLKAVWADVRIAAAVSQMDTLEKMKENIAAALDSSPLSAADQAALRRYADETAHLYCAGCQHICGQALPPGIQVGTTLRYLMYHDSYGYADEARQLFAELPAEARQWQHVDFTQAAALCPRRVDIAQHMRRAAEVLA